MFQNFSAKALAFEPSAAPAPRPIDEVRALVRRYPNLSEIELARLVNLYRDLSALDMALMLSDEKLALRLDRFTADNRSRIRTPFRQYAGLVAYAVAAVAVVVWAAAFAS
jgi:hypothetical protein